MGIRKSQLSNKLVKWIESEVGLGPGVGDIFYLCSSATGADYLWLRENGVDSDHLKTTYTTAYAALTANRNDTLIVLPGNYTQTAVMTWAKSYTHMIGATSPVAVNQRAIFSATTAGTPFITYSANGCVFKNIMWSQDGTHATSYAVNGYVTGARNYFENCTWRNLGALSIAGTACRNMKFYSSDGENNFYRCTFGADTVDYTTGTVYNIEFAASGQTARQVYKECYFLSGGSANGAFIYSGAQGINSFHDFRDCLFFNNTISDMDAMTQAFVLDSACGGFIFLTGNTLVFGAAAWESTNSGALYGNNAYAAATSSLALALTF